MSQFFKLAPLYRGSLFARATSTASINRFGTDPVPILPERGADAFDWSAGSAPTFDFRTEEGGENWWMNDRHESWRNALTPGQIVWVRQVPPEGGDRDAECRSKGLWRIGTAEVGPDRMRLQLTDRIGDVG